MFVSQSKPSGSGSFDPSSLSGLAFWIDASDTASYTPNTNGANVTQINEKSAAALQFNVVSTGYAKVQAAAQNNRNTWDLATGPAKYLVNSGSVPLPAAMTYFAIAKVAAFGSLFSICSNVNAYFPFALYTATPYSYNQIQWAFNSVQFAGDTAYHMFSAGRSSVAGSGQGGFYQLDLGTASDFTTYSANAVTPNLNALFTCFPGSDKNSSLSSLGEAILYNRLLSGAEITQVQTYLRSKWATP